MAQYSEKKIKDIKEYIEIIDSIKVESERNGNKAELIFRGQNVDRPLLPKLARLKLNGEIKNVEKLIIKEFERGIIPLSEFKPENDWDTLALAQHHGLPTRLLDWTYNALVALWFAVSDVAVEKENGVVWILNAETEDFRVDVDTTKPLTNKITKIYRPKVVSRRISAQSGAFTVHKINEEGKMIKLETNKRFGSKLTKVIICPEYFCSIRKSLNTLGVNHSTIFPDLDGFCKHLERRFSKLNDEASPISPDKPLIC